MLHVSLSPIALPLTTTLAMNSGQFPMFGLHQFNLLVKTGDCSIFAFGAAPTIFDFCSPAIPYPYRSPISFRSVGPLSSVALDELKVLKYM